MRDLSVQDEKKIAQMLKRNDDSLPKEIRNELETMKITKKKAELEILQEKDISYLARTYLIRKISDGDWFD